MMAMQEVFIIIENDEEVDIHCKPGAGADTCKYLVMSPNGFKCEFQNMNFLIGLSNRDKPMVAQRDGCDRVNTWFHSFPFNVDSLGTEWDVPFLPQAPQPTDDGEAFDREVEGAWAEDEERQG